MIIQFHFPKENDLDVQKCCKFFLQKGYFVNLQYIMLVGITINNQLILSLTKLDLMVLSAKALIRKNPPEMIGNPESVTDLNVMNKLKRLYITHPHKNGHFICPRQLEEILIYCPEPSEDNIKSKCIPPSDFHLRIAPCSILELV